MNRLFWGINILLLALALFLTMAIVRYAPAPGGAAGGKKSALQRPGAADAQQAAFSLKSAGAAAVEATDTKPIWQQSLFRPDRTEEESGDGGEAAGPAVAVGELDLIGIGIFGDIKAAIILTPAKAVPAPRSPVPAGAAPKKEKIKHVYRVGQTIGDSGYQLKEIRTDEVVIARGTTEQTLKIVFGDDSSLKRQGEAAAEGQRRSEMAARSTPLPSQPGQIPPNTPAGLAPPPPPPAPGGVSAPPAGGAPAMSEETKKRIEEIRMRREEIIRRMREQQAGQNNPR